MLYLYELAPKQLLHQAQAAGPPEREQRASLQARVSSQRECEPEREVDLS